MATTNHISKISQEAPTEVEWLINYINELDLTSYEVDFPRRVKRTADPSPVVSYEPDPHGEVVITLRGKVRRG